MNTEADSGRFGGRDDGLEKAAQVLAQGAVIDRAIALEHGAQPLDLVAVERAGQPRHDGGEQRAPGRIVGSVEPGARTFERFGRPILLSARACQHVDVECRELMRVEAKGRGAAGQGMAKLRAGPVENGHEIVADGVDALRTEISKRLAIGVEVGFRLRCRELDALMDGDALDHGPA